MTATWSSLHDVYEKIVNIHFRVIFSKLNMQRKGFGMTCSFDSLLKFCGVWRLVFLFHHIAVFADNFFAYFCYNWGDAS